jgi:dihydroorotate dehydrogenase electron transfer subunit
MLQASAELVERQIVGAAQELRLHVPELARQLTAGQAVLVRAGWGTDPYLRRTFYPIALDAETWTLRITPGGDWGHAWLAAAAIGTTLDCLGPVGNGFKLPATAHNVLCLGEGDRTWALLPAVLTAAEQGMTVTMAMEATGSRDAIPANRLPATVEYHLTTQSSSRGAGHGGKWGESLTTWLRWADAVLAAGSLDFYARLTLAATEARFRVARGFTQVLYPATFLCGTGACQACASDVAGGRRRVCLRGPVFDLADLER